MKRERRIALLFVVCLVVAVPFAWGEGMVGEFDPKVSASLSEEVPLCHIPPGNPGNAHTVVVVQAAVAAHLVHGDYLGECHSACGGVPSPVPKTGQTTCYDQDGNPIDCAGTGQDGELQRGVAVSPRFRDNLDGTVKDNLTGLVWLKDSNCFGSSTWTDALTASNTLASGSCGLTDGSVAGDWRLPNVRELQSLIDFGQFSPPLPVGHPFTGLPALEAHWSSTTAVYFTVATFYVEMGSGLSAPSQLDYYAVWPVRGVAGDSANSDIVKTTRPTVGVSNDVSTKATLRHIPPRNPETPHTIVVGQAAVAAHHSACQVGVPSPVPTTGQTGCWDNDGFPINCAGTGEDGEYQTGVATSPRFTDNGDGTVKDNLTGLIWLQNLNCFGLQIWNTALSNANTLANGACGLTDGSVAGDWRLPNVKEMQSLIDFGQSDPALPVGHPFTGGPSFESHWSSTTYVYSPFGAWTVHLNSGITGPASKHNYYVAWPVRGQ